MIDVFIAYAHNDLGLKNELKKFLAPLLREKRVSVWDDFDIEAGADWDATIKQRLYAADLVLLLVSADSLASDYFYGKEVQVSLERHQRGEAVVVPVILRHCDWESTPLGSLEALPEKGRPVSEWPTRDQAFSDVVRRLRAVVNGLEAQRQREMEEAEARRQFGAAVEAAEHLWQKEDWAGAATAYAAAAALHRAGFVPEKKVLEQQERACRDQLKARQPAPAPESTAPASAEPGPPRSANTRWLALGVLLAVAVVAALLLGWPDRQNNNRQQTPPTTVVPDEAKPAEPEKGTKPRSGPDEATKKRIDNLLKEGRAFRNLDEPARAKAKFNEVLQLDPGNADAQKNLRELK